MSYVMHGFGSVYNDLNDRLKVRYPLMLHFDVSGQHNTPDAADRKDSPLQNMQAANPA